MKRLIPWLALALLAAIPTARAQTRETAPSKPSTTRNTQQRGGAVRPGTDSEARLQYYASQAALLSALAHVAAFEDLTNVPEADMDMARTYVHTINREIQACEGTSVKVGQAMHSAEKQESMKALRNELKEALKAIDEAQSAVDGHGALGPHAKNAGGHLEMAMIALAQLGDDIGIRPLPAPGADILRGTGSFTPRGAQRR